MPKYIHLYNESFCQVIDYNNLIKKIYDILRSKSVICIYNQFFDDTFFKSDSHISYFVNQILDTLIYDFKTPLEHSISNTTKYYNRHNDDDELNFEVLHHEKFYYELKVLEKKIHSSQDKFYDGFLLQDILRSIIPANENSIEHLHIIISDRLLCTFDESDYRYHARSLICGTPTLISIPGIVEGPAKPREYYFGLMSFAYDVDLLSDHYKKFQDKFLTFNDPRLNQVLFGIILQSVSFFLNNGEPFCNDTCCRLYNAHWQSELLETQVVNPNFCEKHSISFI